MKKRTGIRKQASACLLSILFGTLFLLSGCGKKEEAPAPKQEESAAVEQETAPAEEQDPHAGQVQSVLTGQWIDASALNTRPFAVMIENSSASQPHYGLNSAAVIYEAPVEGGITREMAIFEAPGALSKIGNVRSCRPYYVYLASEYGAVYCHFGQSVQGQEVLDQKLTPELNGLKGAGSKAFYRTNDKASPHNVYTDGAALAAGASAEGIDMTYDASSKKHLNFAADGMTNDLASGTPCTKAALYFYDNKPVFTYDAATGMYNRTEFGQPETDALSGETVSVKNVILQNVESSMYDEKHVRLTLTGTGTGKYLTNGRMIDITWSKENDTAGTRFYDTNGNELVLNQGRTWISLIQADKAGQNTFSAE